MGGRECLSSSGRDQHGEVAFNWELGCGAHTSAQLVGLNGMLSAREEI
jgi:hypothetical protein